MRGFAFCRPVTKEFWLGYSIKSLLASVRANYFPFVQNLGFLGLYRLSRSRVLLSSPDTRPTICLCPQCKYREADQFSAQPPLFGFSDFEQKKCPNIVAVCHECNSKKAGKNGDDFVRSLYRDGILSEKI